MDKNQHIVYILKNETSLCSFRYSDKILLIYLIERGVLSYQQQKMINFEPKQMFYTLPGFAFIKIVLF